VAATLQIAMWTLVAFPTTNIYYDPILFLDGDNSRNMGFGCAIATNIAGVLLFYFNFGNFVLWMEQD